MRSTINLEITITHEANLPIDAQGLATGIGHHLTRELAQDVALLATAKVQSAFIVRQQEQPSLTTTFAGPECDGPNCDGIQHRSGCALYVDEWPSFEEQMAQPSPYERFERAESKPLAGRCECGQKLGH